MRNEIYVETTSNCNLHCLHCFGKNRSKQNEQRHWDRLKEFIKNTNIKTVKFFGGEPMLGDIQKMKELQDALPNVNFCVTTNLIYNLTPEKLNYINNLNEIKTSFDLGIRFTDWKQVIKWYNNIKKIDKQIMINVVITNKVIEKDPVKFKKALYKIKNVERVYIYQLGVKEWNKDLEPDYEKAQEWCKKFNEAEPKENQFGKYEDIRCTTSTKIITSDGNIYQCQDNQDCVIGNIYDINTEEEFKKIYYKECPINIECLTCEFFKQCEKKCYRFKGCIKKKTLESTANNGEKK